MSFSGTFWKILTKNLRLFAARSPLKIVYIIAKGAFRKILSSFGDPLVGEGVEFLKRKEEAPIPPPSPPINTPLYQHTVGSINFLTDQQRYIKRSGAELVISSQKKLHKNFNLVHKSGSP